MLRLTERYMDRVLIDYDIPYEVFTSRYREVITNRARKVLGSLFKDIGYSRSNSGNTHVTIYLTREIPERYVMIIAVFMGSDVKRECMNWFRYIQFNESGTLFANQYTKKAQRHCNPQSNKPLREFIDRTCLGLRLWVYKYATLMNYIPGWDFSKIL